MTPTPRQTRVPRQAQPTLLRRVTAEALGTLLLVAVVVGSGIAAQRLSPGDVGLQLLENSTATALGLAVLIAMFGPISGAHLNPVVSAVAWLLGRRSGTGPTLVEVAAYSGAQLTGGVVGAVVANLMFDLPAAEISATDRTGGHLVLGEAVATAGLITLIFSLARTGRGVLAAPAVGAYIGAAYWFTSSTSFANPAVTVGRVFTDSFAGIAPGGVPWFIAAQFVGGGLAAALVSWLYPELGAPGDHTSEDVVVPHGDRAAGAFDSSSDHSRSAS